MLYQFLGTIIVSSSFRTNEEFKVLDRERFLRRGRRSISLNETRGHYNLTIIRGIVYLYKVLSVEAGPYKME